MTEYITATELERCLKAMSVLDIIITPKTDSWLRLINFCKDESSRRYVIDNGSGDTLEAIFSEYGVLLKGFDHENLGNTAQLTAIAFAARLLASFPSSCTNFA